MDIETLRDFISELRNNKVVTTESSNTNIKLSKDGSVLLLDEKEALALCYFCGIADIIFSSTPIKWSLIYGGTPREPKRFFICERCAHSFIHSL